MARRGRGARFQTPRIPRHFGVVFTNPTYREKWDKLVQLKCCPSRYLETHCLEVLGIYEDVMHLCQQGGVALALTGNWPSYRRMMLEFLSSLKVVKKKQDDLPPEPVRIEFQLNNTSFSLTVEELNVIYKCPGGPFEEDVDFLRTPFWQQLSRVHDDDASEFDPRLAKTSSIRNPVFRFIQRASANSLFARYDGGNVQRVELYMLWCMLRGRSINLGAYIAEHLGRNSIKKGGHLMCGGMITPIAAHCNVNFSEWERIPGDMSLSLEVLNNMDFIKVDQMKHCFFTQRYLGDFPMPNRSLTHVSDWHVTTNWRMCTETHLQAIAERPPVLPFRAARGGVFHQNEQEVVPDTEEGGHQGDDDPTEIMEEDFQETSRSLRRRPQPLSQSERMELLEQRVTSMEAELHGLRGDYQNMHADIGTIKTDVASMLQMMQQWRLQFPPQPPPP